MNTSEKFCLKWNDFQENVKAAFTSLREDKELSDVTLVCEDGNHVEAHKVILGAASPFFQNIFKISNHAHPLIYMKGMKSEDMSAILDFLYHGEANVYQQNLDSFISIAEELKLKGLTGASDDKATAVTNPTYVKAKKQGPEPMNNIEELIKPILESIKDETIWPIQEIISEKSVSVLRHIQELDEKITSMMSKGESIISNGQNQIRSTRCNMCGKEGRKSTISDHIEANHIQGFSHSCEICGKTSRSRHALKAHRSRDHKQ